MQPPPASDATPPLDVPAFLRAHKERIVQGWTRRVLDDPAVPEANRLDVPALHDHIPRLLDQIIDMVTRRAAQWNAGEPEGRAVGRSGAASAHARARFHQRYSLPQALRELSHLRMEIADVCAREGVALAGEDAALVHAAIDDAMATVAVQMEQAARSRLELERRRLRAVLELLPVGVVLADADGRLVEANPTAMAIWGAPPVQVQLAEYDRFQAWWPVTGAPVKAEAWGLARAIRKGESSRNEEMDILTFDGQRKTILNSAAPLRDASGAVMGGVAVNIDVTEQVQLARALRQEIAFRERFMGILGHDLRNPLASISFAAATLLKREDLPEGALRTVQRIARSAERIAHMVGDLLDVTRVRAGGRLPLEPKPVDLHALCQSTLDELDALHPGRIAFAGPADGVHGEWDPARLAQVISNLVTNALNYSPPASVVRVTLHERGERVELAVHNEGPAIPPEVLPTLFEPFRRGAEGPDTPAGTSQGLGLGLFIVQEIVRAHGGTIAVTSTSGDGTTFTVDLPRAAPR